MGRAEIITLLQFVSSKYIRIYCLVHYTYGETIFQGVKNIHNLIVCNHDRIAVEYKTYLIKIAPAKSLGQDDYELKVQQIFGRKLQYLGNLFLKHQPALFLQYLFRSANFLQILYSYLCTDLQCCEESRQKLIKIQKTKMQDKKKNKTVRL